MIDRPAIVASIALVAALALSACGPRASHGAGDGGAGDATSACGTDADQAGCPCPTAGATRACYTGGAATRGVGTCADGTQTCVAGTMGETFGGTFGPCTGDTLPATAETCGDGLDHDCNGAAGCSDTGCAQVPACMHACHPGELRPCYDGAAGSSGVGVCHAGTQACNAAGQWDTACIGEVTPGGTEFLKCHDGLDNDCNGYTDCHDLICLLDPGCAPMICTPNSTQACYDGPAGTSGVAACHGGTQTCAADGKSWGSCQNEVVPTAEGGHCADGVDNDCNGKIDCADAACTSAPSCCVAQPTTVDGTIYDLYTVNPSGWVVTRIGPFANGDQMTDLAVTPDGRVYGISFSTLYSVNKTTGKATRIGDVPGSSNNGLTFLPDGNLLASDSAGDLKRINPATGAVTDLGTFGNGLSSAGDLVAVANGTLYGVSATTAGGGDGSGNNVLLRIDPATGHATVVGPIGYGNVWGLAYVNSTILGFTTGGQILRIDPQTGAGSVLATRGVVWWGAGMSPLVVGSSCP
jgi:hypothetical protein